VGNYIVQGDLDFLLNDDRLRQLTDDDKDGVADVSVIGEAITSAESDVDLALASRYEVPITGTIPEAVKTITTKLATYYFYLRTGKVPSSIEELRKWAMEQLKMLADGKFKLDIGSDPPEETSSRAATFSYQERQFCASNMSDNGW